MFKHLTQEELYARQVELETTSLNECLWAKQVKFEKNIDTKNECNNSAYGAKFLFEVSDAVAAFVRSQADKSNQHKIAFYFEHIRPIQEQEKADKEFNTTVVAKERREVTDIAQRIGEQVAYCLVSAISSNTGFRPACRSTYKELCWMLNIHPESDYHGMAYVARLVTVASEDTNFFELVQPQGRDIYLHPSEEAKVLIDEARSNIKVAASSHKAMVHPPIPYDNLLDTTGGALVMRTPLLKRPRKVESGKVSQKVKNFNAETSPQFFKDFNNKMSIPYCVNEDLLKVIRTYYKMGYSFKGNDMDINFKQADIDAKKEIAETNERRRKFKEDVASGKRPIPKAKKVKGRMVEMKWDPEYTPMSNFSREEVIKRHMDKYGNMAGLTNSIMDQADYYKDYAAIYFNLHADHRERMYTYATEFSYQGNELAKALIHFAEKKVPGVEGCIDLFDTLANAIGWDKFVLTEKRKMASDWWRDNKATFEAGDFSMFFLDSHKDADAKDPADRPFFDKPIEALGLVVEMLKVDADDNYATGIICHRDARLSGSSINGTILRDREVMAKTSVLPEAQGAVKLLDGYMDAADWVKASITKQMENGCPLAYDLLQYEGKLMSRSALKKPTMAGPAYGMTEYGIKEHTKTLINWDELSKEHKTIYDKAVIAGLRATLPSSFEWMDAVAKAAGPIIKANKSFCFTMPLTGFPVEMWALKETVKRAEIPRSNGGVRKVSLKVYTDQVDTGAIAREVSPSITHSIDAAILMLIERGIKGEFPTATLHDSIGARPGDVGKVTELYRKIMHTLATSDLFSIIFDELGTDVEVPYQNTATAEDIASILEAQHILC